MQITGKTLDWTDTKGDKWRLDVLPGCLINGRLMSSIGSPERVGSSFSLELIYLNRTMRHAVEAFLEEE